MGYHKILVTLDGSELAENALKHALRVAEPDAQVHLLSILEEDWAAVVAMAGMMGEPYPAAADPRAAHDPKAIAAQREYLGTIIKRYEDTPVIFSTEVQSGSVVDTILAVARDGFDLLVMATHGRTGLGRVILGSVVSDVLPKSPCPVLVAPPPVKA